MTREFDILDLGKLKHFLGIEVKQSDAGIYICKRRYAREVLERFGMEESNAVKNPNVPGTKLANDENVDKVDETMFKQLVGSLIYLTMTIPYLMRSKSNSPRLLAFTDSDYVGDLDDRMSTIGCTFLMASVQYLGIKETTSCCIFYHRGGIHNKCILCLSVRLA
ncbi:uncharacterized mitochondrial protein AtMg00810-like [Impatiens glandulifera]|uniref:uncharacterized mitochondrial protein AtMg00810-like n=1 Tax=Impatiens glandulifera TaxID=253017 RepID=UPI001FB189C4|nr:uncharacterized mitochondrial protein AtMg00810-like [Impatiens glandulifera]